MGPLANTLIWVLLTSAPQSLCGTVEQLGYLQALNLRVDPQTVAWDRASDLAAYPVPLLQELTPSDFMPNAFIRGRKAEKGGPTRLVCVRGGKPGRYGQWLLCQTSRLVTTKRSGSFLGETKAGASSFPVIVDRLYAGQLDPIDESHFTIRYELDGKSGVIDGWLMPDDSVKLQNRGGATPQ